jgi:rare lipoprotein A
MRILRLLPLAVGLAVATVAPVTPASAENIFAFSGDTEYRDSISVNHWARKSKLGAMTREDSDERPSRRERASRHRTSRSEERVRRAERRDRSRSARRMVREDDDEVAQSYESPRSRRAQRSHRHGSRTRVASLGSGFGGGDWSGGGSHGMASFYWQPQRVASGGWFNPSAMTAAHKTLPFGTRVRVTHIGNGRSVTVRINDRGPYVRGRIIDLSRAAAGVIGMTGQGVARIRMDVLGR